MLPPHGVWVTEATVEGELVQEARVIESCAIPVNARLVCRIIIHISMFNTFIILISSYCHFVTRPINCVTCFMEFMKDNDHMVGNI